MKKRYPRTLSSGANNTVIALSDMPGLSFDNIFLTQPGIRLIDVGISALEKHVGERLFQRFVAQEQKEYELFRDFFLSR